VVAYTWEQAHKAGVDLPMADHDRHVVLNPAGGWDIATEDGLLVSATRGTLWNAIARARELVGNLGGGVVVIHSRNGSIRSRETVPPAKPNPPRTE